MKPRVGILALQGGFEAHGRMLRRVGADAREVRTAAELAGLEGLVIPGGESTVISRGLDREQMVRPLRALVATGTPVLGTCAGMILLGRDHLDLMDIGVRRNAFGRQLRSFEADLDIAGLEGGPLRAVFIRAPWIEETGADVSVLAEIDGHPVAAEQGALLATAFHPELGEDLRLHERFLARVRER